MAKLTSQTHVGNQGWIGTSFALVHAPVTESEVHLERDPERGTTTPIPVAIQSITAEGSKLVITPEPFNYRDGWTLTVGSDRYTRADVDDEQVEGLDAFAAKKEGEILYRLYSPKSKAPRPLILFLHGGGQGGYDNQRQLVADYGPIAFSERYPDFYIMAPQAPQPANWAPPANMSRKNDFASSDQTGKTGWYREYLAGVCDIIRTMIANGQVDRRRVYVTGLSMGGAGTLRAMAVGAGLFAAAAPVCPTMTPETFNILRGLVNSKLWISSAYVDHTIYRHKYLVDGILALRDAGNQNAHLTLYSPEELAAYDIATDPDMSLTARFSANHAAWVLTYHDEHGIMSWLTEQTL